MRLLFEQFSGIAPKIAPHLLPQQAAVKARNCRFGSGAMKPWHEPLHVASLAKAGIKKTIYRYADQFWFHWLEDVNIVQAPVALDAYGRVYWTGEGYPRVGGSDVVTSGGGTAFPSASYRMGVPAPESAPSAIVSGTPSDTLAPVGRFYVSTYVNQYGGEGPPSDPSLEVEVANGQSTTVTLPGGAPTGNYNITLKNIYRTVKGSSSTEWMLVGTVPVAATTFVDTAADENLDTILPSMMWDGPPDNLAGLVDHPMGSLVGFAGKELLFSEPYRPHAWPYRYAVSDPIVAIGVFGTSILVTTTGKPYLVTGTDPANMSVDRMEKGESCVSKRGFVDLGTACIYPGPSGLWGAGVGDAALLTEKLMTLEQWRAYAPETILGGHYDGKYIGFYDNGTVQGGFILDPATGDFSEIDLFATAAWNDPKTGRLYPVVNGDLVEWNAASTATVVTWRSRPFDFTSEVSMACARVLADSYPVTIEVIASPIASADVTALVAKYPTLLTAFENGVKHSRIVTDRQPFVLPGGFQATRWEVEISGTATVNSVALAGSMKELLG